ncbi:MAG: hypothetical protein V4568_06660 [Pseudomonadota bacterium]
MKKRVLQNLSNFPLLITTAVLSFSTFNAAADSILIYKCKQTDGTFLYSDVACVSQNATKLKVLKIDTSRLNIYESKYDPMDNPANRPLTSDEKRRFFIPEADEVANLDYLKEHPVAKIRMPALEAIEKSTSNFISQVKRITGRLKEIFLFWE